MHKTFRILAVAGVLVRAALGEQMPEYAEPFSVVAIPKGCTADHRATIDRTAKFFGLKILEFDVNPVCCVWMEIRPWRPRPGEDGYIIIHQGGGTLIVASDQTQLDAAADRFMKASLEVDGRRKVPVGLMTSYNVVAKMGNEGEPQAGAGQPATAPESKSEGKEKPQPESKVAPR